MISMKYTNMMGKESSESMDTIRARMMDAFPLP